jgi:hypothetical protein
MTSNERNGVQGGTSVGEVMTRPLLVKTFGIHVQSLSLRYMTHCIAAFLILGASTQVQAEDQIVSFDGEQYRLAFVDVAKDGSITNEYLRNGETLQSWTTMVAVRVWPKSTSAYDTAHAWLNIVRPLLSRKAQIYERDSAAGGKDVLVEAWLTAADKSYIEANLHRFVAEQDGAGVRAYQFAERMVMTRGRSDPSTFMKRRRARFNELGGLRVTPQRALHRQ